MSRDTPKSVAAKGAVEAQVNRLVDLPWQKAQQFDVKVPAGDPIIIPHGFGRAATGYLAVYADQPIFGPFYEDLDSGMDRKRLLVLQPAGSSPDTVRDINLSFLVW